jgi:hypothetical protein
MGFSFIEEEMQKCFPIYINRSHLPREMHRVSWGIMSGKWPRRVTCNLVELGANLIHLNMMRSKVPTRPIILVYEVRCFGLRTMSRLEKYFASFDGKKMLVLNMDKVRYDIILVRESQKREQFERGVVA